MSQSYPQNPAGTPPAGGPPPVPTPISGYPPPGQPGHPVPPLLPVQPGGQPGYPPQAPVPPQAPGQYGQPLMAQPQQPAGYPPQAPQAPQPAGYPPAQPYPQGAPYQQPGYVPGAYPSGPPAKKKGSPLKVIIIIVGIVLALIIAAIVIGSVALKNGDGDSNKFIDALKNGNTASAYAMFSPQLQQVQSQADFQAGVDTLGLSPQCTVTWSSIQASTSTDGTLKEVQGTLTCPNATLPSYNVELKWVKTGGAYKLLGYNIS